MGFDKWSDALVVEGVGAWDDEECLTRPRPRHLTNSTARSSVWLRRCSKVEKYLGLSIVLVRVEKPGANDQQHRLAFS